jgi:hypothetical protein
VIIEVDSDMTLVLETSKKALLHTAPFAVSLVLCSVLCAISGGAAALPQPPKPSDASATFATSNTSNTSNTPAYAPPNTAHTKADQKAKHNDDLAACSTRLAPAQCRREVGLAYRQNLHEQVLAKEARATQERQTVHAQNTAARQAVAQAQAKADAQAANDAARGLAPDAASPKKTKAPLLKTQRLNAPSPTRAALPDGAAGGATVAASATDVPDKPPQGPMSQPHTPKSLGDSPLSPKPPLMKPVAVKHTRSKDPQHKNTQDPATQTQTHSPQRKGVQANGASPSTAGVAPLFAPRSTQQRSAAATKQAAKARAVAARKGKASTKQQRRAARDQARQQAGFKVDKP